MRYLYLIALAMILAMPTVSTLGDEPTADHRLKADCESAKNDSLCSKRSLPSGVFTESGLARFALISGRLRLDPMRYRKGSEEFENSSFKETITVSATSGLPSVYYSYRDDYQRIRLVAEHALTLRVESTLLATGETAVLEQLANGQIRWSTRRDPQSVSELDHSCDCSTLLHIVGHDEPGFEIHLERFISRLLRGRSLIRLAERTEKYLLAHSDELSTVSARQVNELVDQLAAKKCSQRRAASRALSELGVSATPFLKAILDRDDLDTEQRSRIKSLIARSRRFDEDTPSSLACLLSVDREHWQILAKRMSNAQWIAANDHIRRCGLETLQR